MQTPSRPGRTRFHTWMYRVVMSVLLLGLAFNAAVFFAATFKLTGFPYELEYGEGIVLWQASRILHPAEAYHPITQYPYNVFHYPPLYHVMAQAVGLVTGDLLVAARLVTWASAIGVVVVVGLITNYRSEGPPAARRAAALIASLLVVHLPNMDWVPYMRVDLTALFFTVLGLLVFLRVPGRRGCVLAGLAFGAALFTKQSSIAGPAAIVLVLLLDGRVRDAVTLFLVMAILGGSVVAGLEAATHGEFLRHVIAYNRNPIDLRLLRDLTIQNLTGMNALLGLALAVPSTLITARSIRRTAEPAAARQVLLVAVAYFLASSGSCVLAAKAGAAPNYFLNVNVSCCILVGLLLRRLLQHPARVFRRPATAGVLMVLICIGISHFYETDRQLDILRGRNRRLNDIARHSARVLESIRRTEGPVFSDDMVLLMKAGKEVPWEPAIVTVLAQGGRWDQGPLVAMIRDQRLDMLVVRYLDTPIFYSAAVRQAIKDFYADGGETVGRYRIFRPAVAAGR